MWRVELTRAELLRLNGFVRPEIQKIVDEALATLEFATGDEQLDQYLRDAVRKGQLTWTYTNIRHCPLCPDKPYDYVRYPRSGRYHRKGEKNYDKPITYWGVRVNPGFVVIQGSGDMCQGCWEPRLKVLVDNILDRDLPCEIQQNQYRPTRYVKDDQRICSGCQKTMWESEMGRRRVILGQGTYPAVCPHCKMEGSLFNSHKSTDQFRLIRSQICQDQMTD